MTHNPMCPLCLVQKLTAGRLRKRTYPRVSAETSPHVLRGGDNHWDALLLKQPVCPPSWAIPACSLMSCVFYSNLGEIKPAAVAKRM